MYVDFILCSVYAREKKKVYHVPPPMLRKRTFLVGCINDSLATRGDSYITRRRKRLSTTGLQNIKIPSAGIVPLSLNNPTPLLSHLRHAKIDSVKMILLANIYNHH